MLFIFCSALAFSFVLVWIVRYYAVAWNLIDTPNERSEHARHTPRSAGIGFIVASLLSISFFYPLIVQQFPLVFTAIVFVFIVGIYDDRFETLPKVKFTVLTVASILLYFDTLYIDDIGICCGVTIDSIGWLALPFTVFSVVGFTNAMNLVDGLDGLAGSLGIVILGTLFAVGYIHADSFMMLLSGTMIAALAAFLFFNWHPASIFMGDSGSLTLGFVISVLAIRSLEYLSAVSVLYIAAIPLLDTFVVMIRRKKSGRSLFEADKCHIHHVLQTFFHHRTKRTVSFLAILQLLYSLIGMQMTKQMDAAFALIIFILNTLLVYWIISKMIARQKRVCS